MLGILAQADQTFWMPSQSSTTAAEVDWVFGFIFWISAFFFTLIVGLLIFFVIRYRRRKGYTPKESPKSHLGVEIVWTAIPLLVVAAIFWVGFTAYMDMTTPPENTYEIKVIAQKWYWAFEYPNGWIDDKLHVPVDRAVGLTMRSEDFIHSLAIPAFRVKMDVVPGRYNKTWFEATQVGTYDLFCTEYCGTGHSSMITKVIVHESGGYEKWLRDSSDILSPLLRLKDLTDAADIAKKLEAANAPIYAWVAEKLTPETVERMSAWDKSAEPDEDLRATLVHDLNEILKGETIFEAARFEGVVLSDDTNALLTRTDLIEDDRLQLNRYLLSDAFPDAMTRGPDMAEAGRYIYERKGGCASCHKIDGSSNIGPSFLGTFGSKRPLKGGGEVLMDENYVRESIINPQDQIVAGYEPVMPTYKGRLSDREIDAVIAFMKSLKKTQ